MPSSGLLRCVAIVRNDVSEEPSDSIIRVTRIGEIVTTLAVTSNGRTLPRNTTLSLSILVTLMMEALCYFVTSIFTGATRHHIPEDDILHSHRQENLKSCIELTDWTL
jgi:hypothetical protein